MKLLIPPTIVIAFAFLYGYVLDFIYGPVNDLSTPGFVLQLEIIIKVISCLLVYVIHGLFILKQVKKYRNKGYVKVAMWSAFVFLGLSLFYALVVMSDSTFKTQLLEGAGLFLVLLFLLVIDLMSLKIIETRMAIKN